MSRSKYERVPPSRMPVLTDAAPDDEGDETPELSLDVLWVHTGLKVSIGLMCLYWTAVMLLSFLELARHKVGLSPCAWVWLTMLATGATVLGWGVVIAHSNTERGGCLESLSRAFRHIDGWNPLVLQWVVYAVCTGLASFHFLAFYLHYDSDELTRLEQRWETPRPEGLDVLTVTHWQALHLLVLTSWLVIAGSLLAVRIHAALLQAPVTTRA